MMKCIVAGKFLQNIDLHEKLENTGSMPLYECTTNTFWGTGWRIESPQWTSASGFPGNNQLGAILMEVRDLIRCGESAPTPEPFGAQIPDEIPNDAHPINDQCEGAVGGTAAIPSSITSSAVGEVKGPIAGNAPGSHESLQKSLSAKDKVENQGPSKTTSSNTTSNMEAVKNKNIDCVSSSGADSMDNEDGSCISVDSELLSRSSFTAKSVLHEDGCLNHDKIME